MLAEIYGWFTEGFDTADLREAKALAAGRLVSEAPGIVSSLFPVLNCQRSRP